MKRGIKPLFSGAGEGNRTLDVSLGSSSFAIKLHLHLCGTSVPLFEYTANILLCQLLFVCCYKFGIDGADGFFEICRFDADDDIDLACALVEHAYVVSL